eukprot:11227303-Lingulodinium_polyedra.AAC.1
MASLPSRPGAASFIDEAPPPSTARFLGVLLEWASGAKGEFGDLQRTGPTIRPYWGPAPRRRCPGAPAS